MALAGLGALATKIKTNWQGLRDPAGASNRFAQLAEKTDDPAMKAKYMNLADQWGGTAMSGGFMGAMMQGTLGVPASAFHQMNAMQMQAMQGQGSPYVDTGSTGALAQLAGQGYGVA